MSRYPDERRAVITGMGAMTCVGKSPEDFLDESQERRIGCEADDGYRSFAVSLQGVGRGSGVRSDRRRVDRSSRGSPYGSIFAVCFARVGPGDQGRWVRFGFGGSRTGGCVDRLRCWRLPETDQQATLMAKRGALRISPFYIPVMLVNMCSANVSRVFGFDGLHEYLRDRVRREYAGDRRSGGSDTSWRCRRDFDGWCGSGHL